MEGLLALWERARRPLERELGSVADWIREAAKPPPGIEVRTADGTVYTGLALLERNNIIVLFAVGERGPGNAPQPSPARYAEREPDPEPPRYRGSMSLWEHEHRQRLQDDDDWPR